jgi:hypothetical protein
VDFELKSKLLPSFLPRCRPLLGSRADRPGRCLVRGLELIFYLMTFALPATPYPFNNISALKASLLCYLQDSKLVHGLRKIHPLL